MGVHLVSTRVRDDGGKTGTVKVFIPDSFTLAQAEAWALAMIEELDAVTAAKIEAVSIRLNVDISGATLKATPIADRPIQMGVNIGFAAAGTAYRHTVHIPSVDMGLVDAGVFQVTDPLVVDWTNMLTTGDGTVTPSDEYENDLTSVLGGELTFRTK